MDARVVARGMGVFYESSLARDHPVRSPRGNARDPPKKTFFVARARPRARFIAPRARSSASTSSRARANAGVEARGRS